MKKIFLDLGAHCGQGMLEFISILNLNKDWEIHSFEPNPLARPESTFDQLRKEQNLNITLHRAAAWIKDGTVKFNRYGSDGRSQGSLVVDTGGGKENLDFHSDIEVPSEDIYNLIQSFEPDDEIYIKMDIEHSEYPILEDLISRGWPTNIKKIWVEWHNRHVPESVQHAEQLTLKIKELGTDVDTWYFLAV